MMTEPILQITNRSYPQLSYTPPILLTTKNVLLISTPSLVQLSYSTVIH
ncbi:hypothetical protein [Paucilactobacillus vaccinostercus]|jgi:hypothetical protein|nr:hypothetical protein [Paucilactobacillus vaccinostercus]